MNEKLLIARRVARELRPGYLVNLGIGVPTLVARFVSLDSNISSSGKPESWACMP